jgi:hypothetical protein
MNIQNKNALKIEFIKQLSTIEKYILTFHYHPDKVTLKEQEKIVDCVGDPLNAEEISKIYEDIYQRFQKMAILQESQNLLVCST